MGTPCPTDAMKSSRVNRSVSLSRLTPLAVSHPLHWKTFHRELLNRVPRQSLSVVDPSRRGHATGMHACKRPLTTTSIFPLSRATFSATSETVQPWFPAYRLLVAI